MKRILLMLCLVLPGFNASAAVLDCDDLIEKIAARLESKGIADFDLKAVPIAETHPGKKVGTCNQGSMKVLLQRGKSSEQAAADST
jgi:hypothetical protein